MILGVTSAEDYVYHYTKASTALDFILKNGTLRLGPYVNTNDPKETKAWEFGLTTFEDRDLKTYRHSELSAWLSKELKARARLACFSTDRAPLTGTHISDIHNRGFTKPRMWAQYTENHTGVCLTFLKSNLLTVIKRELGALWVMAGPVSYRNRSIARGPDAAEFMLNIDEYEALGPRAYVRWHIQMHQRELFFEKHLDWRDECEWRIVALSDSDEELFIPIKGCLAGVMHGDATDPDVSEALMKATAGLGVEHMGLSWKNSTPWYDYGSFCSKPGQVTSPRRGGSRGV